MVGNPTLGIAVLVLFVVFGCGVLIMQWATMDWTEDERDQQQH